MEKKRILVIGAGPLGSVLAARLYQGGQNVSILARGERLKQIQEFGIILHDVVTDETSTDPVPVVEMFTPEDQYDLVVIVMRKNHALALLPTLEKNQHVKSFLFLGNNAAGPEELTTQLGTERVLIGFPNAAGYLEGNVIHCIAGQENDTAAIPFGESDGTVKPRTHMVAGILASAPGYTAEIYTNMDAWLRTHVALLFPTLSRAITVCGHSRLRLLQTRDGLLLYIRSLRECLSVLKALGYPILPKKFRYISWLPEPLLLWIFKKIFSNELMETAMDRHADAAESEILHLQQEFQRLVDQSGIAAPTLDRLIQMIEHGETLPVGSRSIPLRLFI
ncbi:MAG: ketopantoate reductase family protein [Anaerolineales bacterium]|nr:ketopantoate reductase family protein [Anaerolineales bacterium]